MIYALKKRPNTKAHSSGHSKSLILREIHSGNAILARLVEDDYKMAQANPATLNNAENLLKHLLNDELVNYPMLQQTVAKLEMSSKEDSAAKLLQDAAKKAYESLRSHEAYELEMLLVEVYIYQGDKSQLEKTLKIECLQDDWIRDARRPLYKSIIYNMLGDTEKAKKYWEEFLTERDPIHISVSHPETNFQLFKQHVNRLQTAKSKR
ncbi:hypothetical protein VNO77_25591 [Canavalia gladiata]|uniref:Uncharacterized protein n=1 Tax=Canavalia gladiata TaxID=3824 RepID=A0AAN9QH85_CANGL